MRWIGESGFDILIPLAFDGPEHINDGEMK